MQGESHVTVSSKEPMRDIYIFRKRAFLNSASTNHTSHILAFVESSHDGAYEYGTNVVHIGDCKRAIMLEFFLGNARYRRLSLRKINLLIDVLTQFREALAKEIAAIEKGE